MEEARKQPVYEEIAGVLRRLPSVIEATVKSDETGKIAGIVLKADGRRPEKYIVRDVETVLVTRFGLDVDHHLIQVEPVSPQERPPENSRLKIRSINSLVRGALFDIDVELEQGGRVWQGHRRGGSSPRARLRLSCEATIEALAPLCSSYGTVAFEGLTCKTIAGSQVIAVVTSVIFNGREESSVGCAFIHRDECEAAVKATLSALNERLALMVNNQKI